MNTEEKPSITQRQWEELRSAAQRAWDAAEIALKAATNGQHIIEPYPGYPWTPNIVD